MLAESAPRIEEQSVDAVAFENRRRERVDERLVAEPVEHCGDERAIRAGTLAEVARKGDRPWIAARKLKIVWGVGRAARREMVGDDRALGVADRLRDRRTGEKLVVIG